jgi:nucleoside-diphosphate-sugar epimerase
MSTPGEAVIVGCGYVGRYVARLAQAQGQRVTGVVQSEASAARLRALGAAPVLADLDRSQQLPVLPTAGAVVYYFAPPPASGDRDPRIEGFLTRIAAPPLPARVVLISTTGVYGDCAGAWVSEDWPVNPQSDRARRRVAAEHALQAWSARTGVPVVVLRVPGIYGPGKLPEERLRQALPVLRPEESPWSNRVQVEDLARACVAAAERGRPGAVYNISDGHPSTMTDYFNRVADALGLPRPPAIGLAEADARLSAGMRSYLAESKRLDNRRMREELGVEPRYPDLDQGLAACLQAEG